MTIIQGFVFFDDLPKWLENYQKERYNNRKKKQFDLKQRQKLKELAALLEEAKKEAVLLGIDPKKPEHRDYRKYITKVGDWEIWLAIYGDYYGPKVGDSYHFIGQVIKISNEPY